MKCPECEKLGLTSTVYEGYSTSTLVAYIPFYDEEGKRHHHDENNSCTNYTCSNDHEFIVHHKHTCWCGWEQQ